MTRGPATAAAGEAQGATNQAAGEQTAQVLGDTLARTGINIGLLAVMALTFVIGGVVLAFSSRRRATT